MTVDGSDNSWGVGAPVRLDEVSGASGFGGAAGATEKDELAAMMLSRTEASGRLAERGSDEDDGDGDGSDGDGDGDEAGGKGAGEEDTQDLRALGAIEDADCDPEEAASGAGVGGDDFAAGPESR